MLKHEDLIDYILKTRATAPAEVAEQHLDLYEYWKPGEKINIGERRKDPFNGKLYEVHAAAGDNLFPPHEVPAVWRRVYEEEWPEWVQPTGAHDAYAKDAKVTHNNTKWMSDYDNNTWEPGKFGWSKAE